MSAIDPELAKFVFTRDRWKCRHCNKRENLTLHHVIYRSKGGSDSAFNLLTLCITCHNAAHQDLLDIVVLKVLECDIEVKFWRRKGWKP